MPVSECHGDKQTASMPAQCQCVSHGDKQTASMPAHCQSSLIYRGLHHANPQYNLFECQRVYHANPHRNLIECQCVNASV